MARPRRTPHAGRHDHDHGPLPGGMRLAASLVAAIGAELLHFSRPTPPRWHIAGMALAALAIALAGVDIYTKRPACAAARQAEHQRADDAWPSPAPSSSASGPRRRW